MKVTRNWYNIVPVVMGLRKQSILQFRNGLKFFYARGLFSVEHFLEQPYGWADVDGHDVIDIGAFIGDSAIYFSWKGALRVFAFEPIPASYKMALENIRLNGIENIKLFNEAVGLSEGELLLDKGIKGDRSFSVTRFVNQSSVRHERIHVKAFEMLVKELGLKDAILKMDCEGCEYEILLNVKDELLLPFAQVILEYHDGPDKIIERLAKCGFSTRLLDIKGHIIAKRPRKLGLLYASRS